MPPYRRLSDVIVLWNRIFVGVERFVERRQTDVSSLYALLRDILAIQIEYVKMFRRIQLIP